MTKRFLAQLAILAMITSGATSAVAQDDGQSVGDYPMHHDKGMRHDRMGRAMGRGFRDPDRMVEMMQRHLDLDEAQSQQLNNIMEAVKPEIQAAQTAFRENREAIHSLQTSDPDYSVKLQNLSSANGELAAKMTLLHGRIRADVHAVLTPEQLQMMEERGSRFRNHDHDSDHYNFNDLKFVNAAQPLLGY